MNEVYLKELKTQLGVLMEISDTVGSPGWKRIKETIDGYVKDIDSVRQIDTVTVEEILARKKAIEIIERWIGVAEESVNEAQAVQEKIKKLEDIEPIYKVHGT